MADEPNPLQRIFIQYAAQLHDAPGARRLQALAKSAARIPVPVMNDLADLILQLDDVELVGDDISLSLIDIAFCDERCSDAIDFACELRSRLKRYIREPRVADNARCDFHERRRWWSMALSKASQLCKWPAICLTEIRANG